MGKPKTVKKRTENEEKKKEKLVSLKKTIEKKKNKKNEPLKKAIEEERKKKKGPISAKTVEGNAKARMAIATGQLANSEAERKRQQDLRTLYVRFKGTFPSSDAEIAKIHSEIKNVRYPRQARKHDKTEIKYAFIEFSSPEDCEAAKKTLSKEEHKFYVDFVGEKSKNGDDKARNSSKSKRPINPVRLFVNGLGPGVTPDTLKNLFPKCKSADIPAKRAKSKKSSSTFGFVEFQSPADAKAAFDAAKDLNVDGHHITVLYARIPKRKHKQEENKENDDSEPKKKKKKEKIENEEKIESEEVEDDDSEEEKDDENNEEDDDDDDDDSEEVENDEEEEDDSEDDSNQKSDDAEESDDS